MTTPATAVVLPATSADHTAPAKRFAQRIVLAIRCRAGRFGLALLTLVLFLPLLATAVSAGR